MLLQHATPETRGGSRQLVVGVHAYTSSAAALRDLRQAIADALPDADLLFPDYPAGVFSSAAPERLALELVETIRAAAEARQERGAAYEEIIFVGHSLGALLLRKAYAFACGHAEDLHQSLRPAAEEWAPLVRRIVLLAGMNRGWNINPRPAQMQIGTWLMLCAGTLLWTWFRLGRLINSVRRGAPFLVNLRIQWLSLIGEQRQHMPAVIQLLGDQDDIVSRDDNVDVQAGADFVYLGVPNTGHSSVIDFAGEAGKARRRIFLEALTTPVAELKSDFITPLKRDFSVDQVVFVMHGIRDFGHWTGQVGDAVRDEAKRKETRVEVATPGYGYFPMAGFLLQPERQQKVREFMDAYTELLARYPAARVSFIGHSNGTYLLGSALQRYPASRFHHVVLAGSVLPAKYPWDHYIQTERVAAVQNYVATADWVVGIFPQFMGLFPQADLGGAGHTGFTSSEAQRHQVIYITGQHAAALVQENYAALAAFALGDLAAEPPQRLVRHTQSLPVVLASRLCWLIWILLAILVLIPVVGPAVLAATGEWKSTTFAWWLPVVLWPPFFWALLRTI